MNASELGTPFWLASNLTKNCCGLFQFWPWIDSILELISQLIVLCLPILNQNLQWLVHWLYTLISFLKLSYAIQAQLFHVCRQSSKSIFLDLLLIPICTFSWFLPLIFFSFSSLFFSFRNWIFCDWFLDWIFYFNQPASIVLNKYILT